MVIERNIMSTYFISDLHFHHKNILIYEPDRMTALAKYIAADGDVNETYNTLVSMYNGGEEPVIKCYECTIIC